MFLFLAEADSNRKCSKLGLGGLAVSLCEEENCTTFHYTHLHHKHTAAPRASLLKENQYECACFLLCIFVVESEFAKIK